MYVSSNFLFKGAINASSSKIGRGFGEEGNPNATTIRVLNDTSGKYLFTFIFYFVHQAGFTLAPITFVVYTPGQVFTLESKEIEAGKAGDITLLKAVYDVEVVYANEKKVIR
jgi:hypothetical protein